MNSFISTESLDPRLLDFSVRLMISLLHFLWQGVIAALLVVGARYVMRLNSANVRYIFNFSTLIVLACCLPMTFLLTQPSTNISANEANLPIPDSSILGSSRVDQATQSIADTESEVVTIRANFAEREYIDAASNEGELDHELLPFAIDTDAQNTPSLASNPNQTSEFVQADSPVEMKTDWLTTLAPILMSVYFAGVVVMLIRLFVSVWKGHRLRINSTTADDTTLTTLLTTLSQQSETQNHSGRTSL